VTDSGTRPDADTLGRAGLLRRAVEAYERDLATLGDAGTDAHRERGRAFPLAEVLASGGALQFPHILPSDCGYQVAACVQACLDAGADTVLVLGVMHPGSDETEHARRRINAGGDPAAEPLRGVQGPGLDGPQDWRSDHSLMTWRHLWTVELRGRGLDPERAPRVVERYPFLAAGDPASLPGIEELEELARSAAVVVTADPFHHGIGYGMAPEDSSAPDAEGLRRAGASVEAGMAILEGGDYPAFARHCEAALSDARDGCSVMRHLRGPLRGELIDMTFSDSTDLWDSPPPTWCAGPLVAWRPPGQ